MIFLFRDARYKREAGDWNEMGEEWGEGEEKGESRQMLNGACKYRERRDTKGAPKRSGVRADSQKGRGRGRRERCTRSGRSVPGQKDSARGVPSRKRRTGKGVAAQRVVLTAFCRVRRSRKKKK